MSTTETGKLRRALVRIAEELEDDEVREDFEALKNRKVTYSEVLEAIREAPAEERKVLREILVEEMEPEGNGPPSSPAPPAPARAATAVEETPPGPPARRKRPGRKSGAAYDWYVDEESGEVTRSPVAVIYSGEDEPDEVEMLDLPPVGEEDEGREGE